MAQASSRLEEVDHPNTRTHTTGLLISRVRKLR